MTTSVDTNDRGQRIYRCWNRGTGCRIPGRSANGLHRAARLGISELRNDDTLYDAFEQAATMLRNPAFDFDAIWDRANDKERRSLIEELIEQVRIYADRLKSP